MIGIYCHHTSRFGRNTGIQRCLRATSRALAELGEAIVPLVWHPERQGLALANPQALEHLARWNGPPLEAWTRAVPPPGSWLLVVELLSGPHQPSQAWLRQLADRHQWRLAGVFHDAIPLRWGGEAAQYHRHYMQGLAVYDLVLANSRSTARDLAAFWQAEGGAARPTARLEALPLAEELPGCERLWPTPPSGQSLRLLCVGSLEPRKNHRSLLKALAWLVAQGEKAVVLQLVGWANDAAVVAAVRRAQALGLPVHWDGDADDAALLAHYQQSDLCVYPSLEEGFGLPVAESLWLGRPCVCGATGALAEHGEAGGCVAVDMARWQALAQVLAGLIQAPQTLQQLNEQLRRRPLRRWRDYGTAMLALMGA